MLISPQKSGQNQVMTGWGVPPAATKAETLFQRNNYSPAVEDTSFLEVGSIQLV